MRDLADGIDFRGIGFSRRWNEVHRAYKASRSYVTGSHSLKFGMTLDEGTWPRTPTSSVRPTACCSPSTALPWYDVQLSGFLQNLPGVPIVATWNAPVSAIEPSLGRPLAGEAPTAEIHLIQPGTMFADRLNQLDIRLSKLFRFDADRELRLMLDAYNMFNDNAPLAINDTYGSQ